MGARAIRYPLPCCDHGQWRFSSQRAVCHRCKGRPQYGIEHVAENGDVTVLKENLALLDGEIIDATVMNRQALLQFLETQVQDAKDEGILFSLHMKATMMKVSDPKIFGHVVKVYYADVFEKHSAVLDELGVDPNNGIGDLYNKIGELEEAQKAEILADIDAVYEKQPRLAMVNSDKGITNLHVPSDVIIDASVPACLRSSGKMWGPDGELHDTKAIIPDRSYARMYQAVFEFCKENGAFDVPTMGNVSNVGLMARKAEEYGSHDKTFEIPSAGVVFALQMHQTIRSLGMKSKPAISGACAKSKMRPYKIGSNWQSIVRERLVPQPYFG